MSSLIFADDVALFYNNDPENASEETARCL